MIKCSKTRDETQIDLISSRARAVLEKLLTGFQFWGRGGVHTVILELVRTYYIVYFSLLWVKITLKSRVHNIYTEESILVSFSPVEGCIVKL